ncbi:ABC transporter ATP-binding protein [Fusibacter paucivorans]|uniref:ABC transporter ATP-binding protein n=1 Tax=Fusibacter paucivorans TaxID=76009 RepID=A0ABS5PS14_9FIRM|nr:ABC transporter ATP-binding protein [Fusibacter paucivorans]MBS7527960.1 ABC transporter ATP-binding protein [Fusibacter paucivorans]
MNTKSFAKKMKEKNKGANRYMFISVLPGIATTFLSVWLMSLFMQGAATRQNISLAVIGICFMQFAKAFFYAIGIWHAHHAAYQSLTDIRLEMIAHLKQLPISFFQKRSVGDLTKIISHDVEQIEVYLAHAQPEMMITKLVPVLAVIGLTAVDWRLALVLVLPFPLMVVFRKITGRLWGKTFKRYAQSTKEMSEDLTEYISGMPTIKAFATDEQKTETILLRINTYIDWMKKIMHTISIPTSLTRMLLEIGIVLVVLVGVMLMNTGELSTTRFILAIILAGMFPSALIKLMTFNHTEIVLGRSLDSIASIMGEAPKKAYAYNGNITPGAVKMRNVSFSYDGSHTVLQAINLVFEKNTVNAIVGLSGSGKSTIANLIMGFWPVTEGHVTIGDHDINKLNEKDISKLVSIVQQDVFMYNASIAENIRIGRSNASMEDVISVAKKAQIHDMISQMPNGYDTLVGEAGAKLSGGEKQRIAIARIMLKNAPIIILDEATAAIDAYNEKLIQEAIHNLCKQKTLIVIAHHLNTIANADQIVVMDRGRVAATGKHNDLLENCSIYSEMVHAQNEVDHWEIRETKGVMA